MLFRSTANFSTDNGLPQPPRLLLIADPKALAWRELLAHRILEETYTSN